MTAPLVVTEQIVPTPTGGGWFYVRTWHMAGHHQSGIDFTERVSAWVLISQAAALVEVRRRGIDREADHDLLKHWDNNGGIH